MTEAGPAAPTQSTDVQPRAARGSLKRYLAAFLVLATVSLFLIGAGHNVLGIVSAVLATMAAAVWSTGTPTGFTYGRPRPVIVVPPLPRQREEPLSRSEARDEVDSNYWKDLPPAPNGYGYIYVVLFETGVVKVGQTIDPASRIATHRRDAWTFNVAITDAWISGPHQGHLANETALIAFTLTLSGRVRREYFHGADFAAVLAYAEDLTGNADM
jgi:hypothetical protein